MHFDFQFGIFLFEGSAQRVVLVQEKPPYFDNATIRISGLWIRGNECFLRQEMVLSEQPVSLGHIYFSFKIS